MLAAAGIGAALMYFLDPERGATRRAHARGRAGSLFRDSGEALQQRGEDIRNRFRGAVAEARSRFGGDDEPTDVQLMERVRSALGHHTEHAASIEVLVSEGVVTLRGEVPGDELLEVLGTVRRVRGVREVHDEMMVRGSSQGTVG
jgi:osmotically-inducible protein OsmY